ncbi:MAG: Wzz/FepE/Etk N-terminal domain-containing protein [Bacteroidales bacterium]|nr:Wzz/FepE/Etk N-terminal domain-containing protein [Bacteroidales bacterium]
MNERETEYKYLNRERVISLSDLFEEILRKIWLIIILAVIFAVICAGYKYMSDRSKAQATTKSESYEKAESSLTDEEKSEVNSVLMLYDEVAAQQEYMDQSILMNIDPYHEDRVVMQYALQADTGIMTNALQAVDNYVTGGSLVTDLEESYPEEDSAYLSELISYDQGENTEEQTEAEEETEVVGTTAIFWVQIIHSDQAAAEQLADEVANCIDSFARDLTSYFGACEINFLSQSVTQVYDSSLKNIQSTVVSDQITQQNKIVTQTDTLSENQVSVLEASLAGDTNAVSAAVDSETEGDTSTQASA